MARLGVVGWMVWDRQLRRPAKKAGRQLIGLEEAQAEALHAELNSLQDIPADRIPMSARELVLRIRAESDLTVPWPRGANVTVLPGTGGRWQAKCYTPDPVRDAAFIAHIMRIARDFHSKFALH